MEMPDNPNCCRCGGQIVYGEAPHVMDVNGEPTYWCADCIEEYSAAVWPDDYGPRPPRMHDPHRVKQ